MKSYICDICEAVITEPHWARMVEFCFTFSNCDLYQVPTKGKIKKKIHLCHNCFEGFKGIAKNRTGVEKGGAGND